MPNKTLRDIAIEIGINVNTLKSRIYRAEMAGKPKARRDHESKRRSPLWKRNGDISLGDHCPKCGGPVEHRMGRRIDRCIMCGLTSESISYYDAVRCCRVDIKTALVLMRLNSS
jgi:ribosomal protein L37AE/L43A